MSRLASITAAATALAALDATDRAIAIEHSQVKRRGRKPGPKPGSTRKAPTPAKKSAKKAPSEGKAEKAKRLISEGS